MKTQDSNPSHISLVVECYPLYVFYAPWYSIMIDSAYKFLDTLPTCVTNWFFAWICTWWEFLCLYPPLNPPLARSPWSPMNQINFLNDPQDLTDALNEEEDIFTPPTIAIKPSSYFEFEEFLHTNAEPHFYNNFSMLSFNIRSLHGKFEEFKDFLSDVKNRFSIICLQEIWSVSHEYPLEGYQSIEFNTRDAHLSTPNRKIHSYQMFLNPFGSKSK